MATQYPADESNQVLDHLQNEKNLALQTASPLHCLHLVAYFFLSLDFDALALDRQSKPVVDAHVLVGYPDESELRDHVSAPVAVEQFVSGQHEKPERHVMTEAVFTREQEKELSPEQAPAVFAFAA